MIETVSTFRKDPRKNEALFVILSDYTVLRHLNPEIHEGGFFQCPEKKKNISAV